MKEKIIKSYFSSRQAAAKQAPPAVFITDRTNRSIDRKPEPTYEEPVARNKAEHSPRGMYCTTLL